MGVVQIRVDENGKKARKQLEVDFVVNQGITIIGLFDFLLNDDSLDYWPMKLRI